MEKKLPLRQVEYNWCHTASQLVTVNFVWTIYNFKLEDPFRRNKSNAFSAKEDPSLRFHLTVINKVNCLKKNIVFVTIDNGKGKVGHNIQLSISVLNKKNEKIFTREHHCCKEDRLPYSEILCEENKLNDLLNDGNLTICCEIVFSIDKNLSGMTSYWTSNDQIVQHLEELFKNKTFSDVTIDVHGHQFQAHKNILARSRFCCHVWP